MTFYVMQMPNSSNRRLCIYHIIIPIRSRIQFIRLIISFVIFTVNNYPIEITFSLSDKKQQQFLLMDPYNSPYYPESSRNYSRQQTPFTNQYLYDDMSDNLRVSTPFSQDFYQVNPQDNPSILRKQLNEQMKRQSVLLHQVNQLQYKNQQLKRNQQSSSSNQSSSFLRQENEKLREEIQRKKRMGNVPKQIIDDLSELRRENSWLRQNTANLSKKNYSKY